MSCQRGDNFTMSVGARVEWEGRGGVVDGWRLGGVLCTVQVMPGRELISSISCGRSYEVSEKHLSAVGSVGDAARVQDRVMSTVASTSPSWIESRPSPWPGACHLTTCQRMRPVPTILCARSTGITWQRGALEGCSALRLRQKLTILLECSVEVAYSLLCSFLNASKCFRH